MMNTNEMVLFWKGRIALYAILKALDIGPGDAVLVPGYTCMVVPSAVAFLGARPIYADVELESYNVSQNTLEEGWRHHNGPRPRAAIIQHTYGIPVDADPIVAWAKDEGLAVIEDCAHALGSSYKGTPCGYLGDAAFFSSQWSKPITTGLGGWALAKNIALAARLRRVQSSFRHPGKGEVLLLALQFRIRQLLFRPSLFWPLMNLYRTLGRSGLVLASSNNQELAGKMPAGYACCMSNWQQARLKEGLARIQETTTHRQEIAQFYEEKMIAWGKPLPKLPTGGEAVFVRYPVLVEGKEDLLSEAQKRRMELGDWFISPLHPLLGDWEMLHYRSGICPRAEELCRRTVNLPTHERVSLNDAHSVFNMVAPHLTC